MNLLLPTRSVILPRRLRKNWRQEGFISPALIGAIAGSRRQSGAATTFTDTFSRADEAPLSNGGAWTSGITGFAQCVLVSHLVHSFSGNGMMLVGTPSFTSLANQKATITLSSVTGVGASVRLTTAGNAYLLYCNTSTQIQFYKITAGSTAQIGSNMAVTTMASGDTIALSVSGTTLTAYHNGVSKGTTTDATWSSGSPGFWSSGTPNNISAFTCTSL